MLSVDRVRAHTPDKINERIDRDTRCRIRDYAERTPEEITRRIDELDKEWDIERYLETNASAFALSGIFLGITRSKKWLAVPGIVLPFLLQHAVQGWCPPISVFRRMGARTRREIEQERYALKALRGDFAGVKEFDDAIRAVRS